jgi:hypothetical protein
MAPDDDDSDDLYDDEFDFVDEDEDLDADDSALSDDSALAGDEEDAAVAAEAEGPPREAAAQRRGRGARDADDRQDGEEAGGSSDEDAYERPAAPANFRVHVYEFRKFKRTIDRPFTAEDAEAFASEYNRTAKPYGRFALAGKEDASPKKSLD